MLHSFRFAQRAALLQTPLAQLPTKQCIAHPSCQVALNWLICKGAVPIPGAKNAAQATANAGALGWRLRQGEVEELDELAIEGTLKLGQHG